MNAEGNGDACSQLNMSGSSIGSNTVMMMMMMMSALMIMLIITMMMLTIPKGLSTKIMLSQVAGDNARGHSGAVQVEVMKTPPGGAAGHRLCTKLDALIKGASQFKFNT